MSKRTALVALLLLTFSILVPGQTSKASTAGNKAEAKAKVVRLDAETERALARFGEFSLAAVREQLVKLRPAAYLPSPYLMSKFIEQQQLPVVSSERVDHLKAALQPVLAYHQREQMPIIGVSSTEPKATLVRRAVLVITTRMMVITSDEEMRGIVAHELAHEYLWEELKKAQQVNDEIAMRECELFCDVVAAVTLKAIGDNPASYFKALERLISLGVITGGKTHSQLSTHPSLEARKKLNQFLCQQLSGNYAGALTKEAAK